MVSVEIQIELGHKAHPRPKPTAEGFTHDWTVYVRGSEGASIQHFVEKVVFNLHESFPKPRRVIKEPPFQVSESGYAGFEFPIEVYFKNKDEPKKVKYMYDLNILAYQKVNIFRREKLTFQNPSNEFKKKLLKAKGIMIFGILGPLKGGESDFSGSNGNGSRSPFEIRTVGETSKPKVLLGGGLKMNPRSNTENNLNDRNYIRTLLRIQQRIGELKDRELLQKVVDLIEESGLFVLTPTTLDFDLMKLDRETVNKLNKCLNI